MKKIIPEIFVENGKEALEFYQGVFGGEIKNIQMADGKEMFKGFEGKIIHSELHINNDCILYLYDILRGQKETGSNDTLVELDNEQEIRKVFDSLSKNGTVHYKLQKTFWGAWHAVVIDCYGNRWALNASAM